MAQYGQHNHDMKMYGDIKLYAGSGSPELAQKIANYLEQKLSPREVIQFPNENISIKFRPKIPCQAPKPPNPHKKQEIDLAYKLGQTRYT